jgi:glucose-6-phosphate 1-dehydrogenase
MPRCPPDMECPADPCAIVIFGVTGDLARRKLLPTLYDLWVNGLLPRDFALIGFVRKPMDDEALRDLLSAAVREFATRHIDPARWAEFRARIHCVAGDAERPETFRALGERLAELDREHRTGGNALFYLATPPEAFAPLVRRLGETGLVREDAGHWRRVVVEKPFGYDLDSARALNDTLTSVLREEQIFRIDHYLGKETVQNIIVFRFANGIFEPVWNRRYVDHVQITVAEQLGVEKRGAYFDRAGALRDVIQNHVLQLLTLVAMEPPSSLTAEAVRDEKVKVLDAIRPMHPEEILVGAVRGQYDEGVVNGRPVPAYRQEKSVSPRSSTETYAALRLSVDNWRWAGVPFYVRSGKRLARRKTLVAVAFRSPPLLLFRGAGVESIERNRLEIHIQPDEGIALKMKAKIPGQLIRLTDVDLRFSYEEFGPQVPATGYERLLYDCMVGDATLFHRWDQVEAAWRIVTPVLDQWANLPARDFPNYPAGSWGPAAADGLLRMDGRRWVNLS